IQKSALLIRFISSVKLHLLGKKMNIFRNMANILSNPIKNLYSASQIIQPNIGTPSLVSIRSKYTDWRMLRDVKRRKVVKEYAKLRLQINAVRYNTLLPKEIQRLWMKIRIEVALHNY
ncbi:28S ribosomal protein S14, mitochondrial, partial [Trichonephila clavata]